MNGLLVFIEMKQQHLYLSNCELRRFFASHARTFAHLIFGRTHIARTCAFCPKFISHPHTHVYGKRVTFAQKSPKLGPFFSQKRAKLLSHVTHLKSAALTHIARTLWKPFRTQGASCCDVIFQTVKVRRHRGQILAVWFQTDLQPLMQNLCLASDSKKVKTKSSLNSLGITDMVLDNQWASN